MDLYGILFLQKIACFLELQLRLAIQASMSTTQPFLRTLYNMAECLHPGCAPALPTHLSQLYSNTVRGTSEAAAWLGACHTQQGRARQPGKAPSWLSGRIGSTAVLGKLPALCHIYLHLQQP